jgi:hypothetical protein
MSEREEIESLTTLGVACGGIQCSTLKARCVACREEDFPGGELQICLTNQFPFSGEEQRGSHRGHITQLPEAKQDRGGTFQIQGPRCRCWHSHLPVSPGQPGPNAAAPEINDMLTSACEAGLCLLSCRLRGVSLKATELSDKRAAGLKEDGTGSKASGFGSE